MIPTRHLHLLATLALGLGASLPTESLVRGQDAEVAESPGAMPNILVIMTDQQNRQTLGSVGNRGVKTPALDRLAAEGVLFRWGYCNDPICTPSRYSMLSGVHATEIGAFQNRTPPRRDIPLLADRLSEAGYLTGMLGKADVVPSHDPAGFEEVYLHTNYQSNKNSHWYPWFSAKAKERGLTDQLPNRGDIPNKNATLDGLRTTSTLPDDLTPEAWITEKSLKLMRRAKAEERPFFVYANYFAPHHPYGPVQKYLDLYERDGIVLPPNFSPPDGPPRGTGASPFRSWSEEEWREILHHYYAFVSQLDFHVGALLEGMRELDVEENTLVFFVSDHGDMAGEFGCLLKGIPFEGSIGVPFIVRWPKRIEGGQILDAPVSLIDIAPTILEAIGGPVPELYRGESLLPLISGEQEPSEREVYVIDVRRAPFHIAVVRDEHWKLFATGSKKGKHRYRLVNLTEDPHELIDRQDDPKALAAFERLQSKLSAFLERESQFVPDKLPKLDFSPPRELPFKD